MEVRLRTAEESDYDGIMAISKGLFGGYDYLPHVLKKWLKEGRRYNLVLVDSKSDQVLGFTSYMVQDQGRNLVSQGMRLDEELRGRNLGKTFMALAAAHIAEKDFASQAQVNFELDTPLSVLQNPLTGTRIGEKGVIITEPRPWDGHNKFPSSNDGLRELTLTQLVATLRGSADARQRFLLQDAFLLLDWVPYHLNDLLDLSVRHHQEVVILADAAEPSLNLSVLTLPYPVPGGLKTVVDLFSKDAEQAKLHFRQQIWNLSQHLPDQLLPLLFQFIVDVDIAEEMKRYIEEEAGLGRVREESLTAEGTVHRLHVFLKDLHQQQSLS